MIKTQTQDCQAIPQRLEILEEYLAGFERTGKKPLAGLTALLIQHQLGSQVRMTEGLIRLGIDPKKIYWVDIPYTANSIVQKELCRLRIFNQIRKQKIKS